MFSQRFAWPTPSTLLSTHMLEIRRSTEKQRRERKEIKVETLANKLLKEKVVMTVFT